MSHDVGHHSPVTEEPAAEEKEPIRAQDADLVREVTIMIVTHNMQQAQRVSNQCASFLAAQGEPGHIVEHGPTDAMFGAPQDPRTADYVNGRFG